MKRLLSVICSIVGLAVLIGQAQAAQVALGWDPNVPTPNGYHLFHRMEGQAYNYSAPVDGKLIKSSTYTVTGLPPGRHFFEVRAVKGVQSSGSSNEVAYIARETASCLNLLGPGGARVEDIQAGTYFFDGYPGYVVNIFPAPEENDRPPYSKNRPGTIWHNISCRYYTEDRGIFDPADCPTCRPCKICNP